MTKSELKACPFCGAEAEIKRFGTSRCSALVGCTQCHAEIESGDTEEDSAYSWNTRTLDRESIEHVVRKAVEMAREDEQREIETPMGVFREMAFSKTPDEIVAQILKDMEQGNE